MSREVRGKYIRVKPAVCKRLAVSAITTRLHTQKYIRCNGRSRYSATAAAPEKTKTVPQKRGKTKYIATFAADILPHYTLRKDNPEKGNDLARPNATQPENQQRK